MLVASGDRAPLEHSLAVYFSLMKRISNLHTDENNFERNSKLFSFMFVYWAFYTFYWLKSLKYFIKSK